jgi:hypothetical protein
MGTYIANRTARLALMLFAISAIVFAFIKSMPVSCVDEIQELREWIDRPANCRPMLSPVLRGNILETR